MSMHMHMVGTLIVMFAVLIVVLGGVFLVLRNIGAQEVKDDHPH